MDLRGLVVDLAVPRLDGDGVFERLFTIHLQRMARIRTVAAVLVNGPVGRPDAPTDEKRRRLLEVAVQGAPAGFPVLAGVRLDAPPAEVMCDLEAVQAGQPAGIYLYTQGSGLEASLAAALEAQVELPVIVGFQRGSLVTPKTVDSLRSLKEIAAVSVCVANVGEFETVYGLASPLSPVLVESLTGRDVPRYVAIGAQGAVIAAANVAPDVYGQLVSPAVPDASRAKSDRYESVILPLVEALENAADAGDPTAALKTALQMRGFFNSDGGSSAARVPDDAQEQLAHAIAGIAAVPS